MKQNINIMDETSIRKHKMEVSYTNSFPFRARCTTCGGLPDARVFRSSMYYAWESPQEYHKQGMNASTLKTRMKIEGLSGLKKAHLGIHAMKMAFFNKEPGRWERRECWPRIVFCKCRATHWTFHNVTDLHSPRFISLLKKR